MKQDEIETPMQKLVKQFESIQKDCKTMQEVIFFDGVIAVIKSQYLELEQQALSKKPSVSDEEIEKILVSAISSYDLKKEIEQIKSLFNKSLPPQVVQSEVTKEQIINFALEAVTRYDELIEHRTMFKCDDKWLTIDDLFIEFFQSLPPQVVQSEVSVQFKDHDKIILTDKVGNTYTSKSEELMDFLHGASKINILTPPDAEKETVMFAELLLKNYTPIAGSENVKWVKNEREVFCHGSLKYYDKVALAKYFDNLIKEGIELKTIIK